MSMIFCYSRSKSVEENDLADDSQPHKQLGAFPKSSTMHQIASSSDQNEQSQKASDDDWSITFEQFLANILNENALVGAFDEKIDVVQRLLDHGRPPVTTASAKRNNGSSSGVQPATSEFYV